MSAGGKDYEQLLARLDIRRAHIAEEPRLHIDCGYDAGTGHWGEYRYQPWEKPYFVLAPGDVYNMRTRQIEKYGNGALPRPQPATNAESTAPKPKP